MENTTVTSVNYPYVVSKYTTAFDFEVIDLPNVCKTMDELTPWILVLCLAYIASIFRLQHWMRNRPAYDLRTPLVIWNFGLALFSIIGVLRQFPEVVGIVLDRGMYECGCSPDQHNYATSYWQFLFTLSKIAEFGDTIFLVLRKKKLIFLHWFHHATVLFFSWILFVTEDPLVRRGGIINYAVHSVMYTYFALRALNFNFPMWLSKSITSMQIGQFAAVVVISIYGLGLRATGVHCGRPLKNDVYIVGMACIYIMLFINFFNNAYRKEGKINKKTE